jgi:predicted RNase H-like nuclease (RuvC/YqgF family)
MRCGVLDDLHAHHIKPKSTHADLKLSLENGVTLCYRCHKAEHERNRPVRIRSNRPQRKTMERRIAELEQMVAELDAENRALKNQAGKCKRGFCESGFEVSRLKCLLRDMQSGKCAA